MSSGLQFRGIELPRDEAVCVEFKREAYVCSFGDDARFYEQYGTAQAYLAWLRARMQALPPGGVHVWRGGEVVGQLELAIRAAPETSSVTLVVLRAALRGTGAGAEVHRYLRERLEERGVRVAELRVSPTNGRALRYYLKHGWRDLGPDPAHPEVHRMRLELARRSGPASRCGEKDAAGA